MQRNLLKSSQWTGETLMKAENSIEQNEKHDNW